ncbi:MAG TPA: CYCXC family (seleno)protein [Drouetiella sp.]
MKSGATTIFGGLAAALALGCVFAWSQWSEITQTQASETRTPQLANGSKTVLPAGKFFGQAAVGYQAAQTCPEVIAKLFCYCGCDMTDKHSSLLDCFVTEHGADCQICTDEAVIAAQMKKDGKSIAEIQKAVDDKYSHEYPFQDASPALKKYREMITGVKATNSDKPTSNALKPGHTAGTCCK